ncbi:MAG: metallophosphatase family protein [Rhodocyclaceae bacterium]|nr:metallophosphatase family protein [Rhodocyclaceae bacterium]
MKICIVSDSHDRGPMLAAAVEEARSSVPRPSCTVATSSARTPSSPLLRLGLQTHVIHGNNLGDFTAICQMASRSNGMLHYHGGDASIEMGGRRIFLVHYPHYGRAMACTGDFDLVCCGHSHKPDIARQPNVKGSETWLVNPGTVAGLGAPSATWVLGDLATMTFSVRPLVMAAV